MGTRSITIINDGSTELCVLYRQHDGYPSGHGADIAQALGGKRMVNGFSDPVTQINGAGDLAVQLIAWLKWDATVNSKWRPTPINSAGGLYLYPAGTRDTGEEYVYTITCTEEGGVQVECAGGHTPLERFKGSLGDFCKWIEAAPWAIEEDE